MEGNNTKIPKTTLLIEEETADIGHLQLIMVELGIIKLTMEHFKIS